MRALRFPWDLRRLGPVRIRALPSWRNCRSTLPDAILVPGNLVRMADRLRRRFKTAAPPGRRVWPGSPAITESAMKTRRNESKCVTSDTRQGRDS
jgi:hypothetical protein